MSEVMLSVGDRVRIKPSAEHYHSNGIGTVMWTGLYGDGVTGVQVELVSPTRRPSLVSYTTFRRAVCRVPFYVYELEVVVMYHGE